MTQTTLLYAAMLVAFLALAAGFLLASIWLGMPAILALAGFWFLGEVKGWGWASHLSLALIVVITGVGLLLNMPAPLAVVTAVAALAAWDIGHLQRLLAGNGRIDNRQEIEQQHRQRLLWVMGASLVLALVAATLRLQFSFSMALFLGLLAIFGFSRAISRLRRESD